MNPRRAFVGGNWKMNTRRDSGMELAREVREAIGETSNADVVVFPPSPYLCSINEVIYGSAVRLGAQNLWHEPDGARTGEVSLGMLQNCGVTHCLTGHSERRHVIGESDELVGLKSLAALDAGMVCVLCIGETLEQRQAGETDAVNERQLQAALAGANPEHTDRLVIAYEPVWAIGTGQTATPGDAQDAHAQIRRWLANRFSPSQAGDIRIIYGGSVKGSNAEELFAQPDIDGGLIGGASLDAADFLKIVAAAAQA